MHLTLERREKNQPADDNFRYYWKKLVVEHTLHTNIQELNRTNRKLEAGKLE